MPSLSGFIGYWRVLLTLHSSPRPSIAMHSSAEAATHSPAKATTHSSVKAATTHSPVKAIPFRRYVLMCCSSSVNPAEGGVPNSSNVCFIRRRYRHFSLQRMLSVWEKHTGRNHTLSSLEEKIQDRAQGRYSPPDGKTGVLDFNSLVFARATAEALT